MPSITIQGYKFEVPDAVLAKYDHFLAADAPESLRSTVRQTLSENLRNNFAGSVRKALNGAETIPDDALAGLQAEFAAYAEKYEFGVRTAGEARQKLDPITREMLKLAKEDFTKAYFAKYGEKPEKDLVSERVEELVDKKREDYMKRAKAILRQREQVATDTLESLGL